MMKKKILKISAFVIIAIAIVSFKSNDYKIETNTIEASATYPLDYAVDINASIIKWKGFKPTGTHNGTIKLSEGSFTMDGENMTAGNFTIEMATLKDVDNNTRLEGHLKGAQFFDIETYPNAKFVAKGISKEAGKTMLTGELTLKDKTNIVSFPVTINSSNNIVTIISETFKIDRSKWNVKYGSKSFFDNLGDKFISDDIELKINVTANVKAH